jgi:hypothetical protein
LTIGGQTIDRLTAERLIVEDDLGVAYENQTGLAILEGKGESSQIYAPREYYTRLTFNMDTLNVNKLYRQDLRVDVDYEKFENLPKTLIPTKSLTDGGSYMNTNIKTLLGLDANARVYHTNFYKKYVVYVVEDTTRPYYERYYFYDTTKPIGSVSSWVYWNDTEFHQLGVVRPYFIGGTMYTCMYGAPYIRSVPVADMLTGTAVATQGAIFFPNLYEGNIGTGAFTADARYLYCDTSMPSITFGSNTAISYTYMPGNGANGRTTGTTFDVVYKVASISTPQLIPSDNVALVNFVTAQSTGFVVSGSNAPVFPTVTITNETKVGSDVNVTLNLLFAAQVYTLNIPGFYTTTSTTLSGSNVATFTSCTPECAFANSYITFKVYNIATPQLIATDNTAIFNYVTTYAQNFSGITKTVTLGTQIKTLSNIFATANVAYTYTSNGQPAPQVMELPFGYSTVGKHITVRYDTTKPLSQWSSYDFLSFSGTGAPKTWFDITAITPASVAPLPLAFDGRYIYADIQGRGILTKIDSQNFLDISYYTYFNVGTLTPVPNLNGIPYSQVPNATDGRYFYFQTRNFTGGSVYLFRYDSTQDISSPSAYQSVLFTSSAFPNGYSLYPYGFDGKSIYYVGGTFGAIRSSILRYDTTTNTVSDWIIFDGNGKALTSQGTTVNTISWVSKNKFNNIPTVAVLSCLVSARYVYLTETWGGGAETFNDFVQFDPLVMTGTLKSSVIVKYEKYTTPPETPQSLYGQTLLSEFTMIQGKVFDSFNLTVPASTREFWVTVDTPAVISRLVLRLNNEVLVDDDRVTTRYIRAFESHSTMPSSSNVSVYSFAMNPEKMSPSGTLNMSRVASPVLDVYLVAAVSTNVKVRFYAKTFNVFQNKDGLGGLLFNSGF